MKKQLSAICFLFSILIMPVFSQGYSTVVEMLSPFVIWNEKASTVLIISGEKLARGADVGVLLLEHPTVISVSSIQKINMFF